MWENKKKYIKIIVLLVVTLTKSIFAQQPEIIARLNAKSLSIHYSDISRAQLYSVLDCDEVVLAVDKDLIFIKNNKVKHKVVSPENIFAFDISKNGNGILISINGLYKIKKFQIQPKLIKTSIEKPEEGKIIWQVDMLNDTIARFFVNGIKALFYIHIDNLESGNYIIKDDHASQFISEKASSSYIGQYEDKFYFLKFDKKEQSEYLLIKENLEGDDPADEKIFKFGDLGRSAPETVPIRYDEETNFFYEMLFKDKEMVLYKFDMKDYD